jgi:hypothetical protein
VSANDVCIAGRTFCYSLDDCGAALGENREDAIEKLLFRDNLLKKRGRERDIRNGKEREREREKGKVLPLQGKRVPSNVAKHRIGLHEIDASQWE